MTTTTSCQKKKKKKLHNNILKTPLIKQHYSQRDGHRQWCSTDVVVQERLAKFEAVQDLRRKQVLMLVAGGDRQGATDVFVQGHLELAAKCEAVRHSYFLPFSSYRK